MIIIGDSKKFTKKLFKDSGPKRQMKLADMRPEATLLGPLTQTKTQPQLQYQSRALPRLLPARLLP